MTFHIEKRSFIRIISFLLAFVIIGFGLALLYKKDADNNISMINTRYQNTVHELVNYANVIDNTLTKISYSNTPSMLNSLSAKLWREAAFAKSAITSLPIEYSNLQNISKLLSQIGDYCVSLSNEFAKGNNVTKEQQDNLQKLSKYSDMMLQEVITLSDAINSDNISFDKVSNDTKKALKTSNQRAHISDSFTEFDSKFDEYPSLIYDGPFSEHILQKESTLLKSLKNVTREQAREKAAFISKIDKSNLQDTNDEESKMPSYGFGNDTIDIAITKKGGLVSYMLKSRIVENVKLSPKQAMEKSRQFMDSLDIGTLKSTYYEISNNVMTINYANTKENVVIYPDLIKVSVALDNGEIVGFDARGYITNYQPRSNLSPKITLSNAEKSINTSLKILESNIAIIPTSGLNEVLCYEFKCKSKDGKDVLVYINAETGQEEQILILVVDDNGQLTV